MNLSKLTRSLLFTSLIIIAYSCSKSSPQNLNTVPKDVNLIYAIDLFSILNKGNFNNFSNSKLMKGIKKQMRNENRRLHQIINDIIENPEILGIDFKEKALIYFIEEAKDEKFFCISLALDSEKDFEVFLNRLTNKLKLKSDLEEEPDYKYYIIEEEMGIGWDKDKALFIFPNNYNSRENLDFEIENLMTLKESNNITNNELFSSFFSVKKDISLLLNSNLFENDFGFQQVERLYDIDLKDNILIANLDFGKKEILMNSEFIGNEEIKDFINDYKIWENKINIDMLKYLPKESFLLSSFSINPSGYYDLLTDEENFSAISLGFEREFGISLQDFFNSAKGNCILSFNNFEEIEYTVNEPIYDPSRYEYVKNERLEKEVIPIYNFIMEINDNLLFEDIIENSPQNNMKKKNGYYEFKLTGKHSEYIVFNDDFLLVTNDKKSINFFLKNGYTNNFQRSELKENVLSNNFYINLNLNYDDYPQKIKKQLRKSQSKEEKKVFKIFTDLLRNASIEQSGHSKLEIRVGLKDSDENSLSNIIQIIDDNYEFLKNM